MIMIPARGGSEGIKDKNIKLFNGKPLIAYAIELAKSISEINKVIVSTDSEEIAHVAREYGAEVPFVRPDLLSGPTISMDDVLEHSYQTLISQGYVADCIVLLVPTNPLRNSNQIKKCIELFYQAEADCVFTVNESPAHYTPYWTVIKDINGDIKWFDGTKLVNGYTRRQDFPRKSYARNDLVYAIKPSNFDKYQSLFGLKNEFIVTKAIYDIDINDSDDWEICEERHRFIYKD